MFRIAVILLIASTFAVGDVPPRPPVLDFKKQVNYIEWWNQEQRAGKEKNAYDIYQKLTIGELNDEAKVVPPETVEKAMRQLRLYEKWRREDQPELAAYIDEVAPQLNLLDQARSIEHSWVPISDDVDLILRMEHPSRERIRLATRLLVYRSWMSQPNQKKALMDCYETLGHVADHLYQHGFMFDMLTGSVVQTYIFGSLSSALRQGVIDQNDAVRVYELFGQHDSGRPNWQALVQAEWVEKLDALNYICPSGTLNQQRWGSFLGTLPFRPERARDLVDRHYERELKLLSNGWSMATLEKYEQYRDRDPFGLNRNQFTSLLIGDIRHALGLMLRVESQRRGTMMTLALLAHKHKHGQWPETLAAIDPGLKLERLDENKIDPITGSKFVYRVSEGNMTLYSIGVDDEDNGGVHSRRWGEQPTDRDFVFWPIPDDN